MKPIDLFPAEVHFDSGHVYSSARVRIEEDGHARVWRWNGTQAEVLHDDRVTLHRFDDETPHREEVRRGGVVALRLLGPDSQTSLQSPVVFAARSGGCECGGAYHLRNIEGAPAL